MLQNAYFLAKIGADTAENEQHFAEILPIGRRVGRRASDASEARVLHHDEGDEGDHRREDRQQRREGREPPLHGVPEPTC